MCFSTDTSLLIRLLRWEIQICTSAHSQFQAVWVFSVADIKAMHKAVMFGILFLLLSRVSGQMYIETTSRDA